MSKLHCKEVTIKNKVYCLVPKMEFMALQAEEFAVDAVEFANSAIAMDLRSKREAAGLTQAEVAKKAKMRPEVLSRIESGNGNPTVSTINRILKAIDA